MKPNIGTRIIRLISRASPIAAGAVCFFFIPQSLWSNSTAALVTALSLISGAILLRLMRAFPVTDPDGFSDKDEIADLERALRQVMVSLSVAVAVAVSVILLLVLRPVLVDLISGFPLLDEYRGEAYSAFIGAALTYLVTRVVYVVRLDFSIVRKQSKAVQTSFERRRSRETAEARRRSDDQGFRYTDDAPFPGRDRDAKH